MPSNFFNQSLWLDEATSVIKARDLSVHELLTHFSPGDFHPPLYYLLLKVWINIFGSSEIAVRSLSVLFALLSVFLIYKIGCFLFDKSVGLVSATLLLSSPLFFYYAYEARMYTMATLISLLVVWFGLRGKRLFFILSSVLLLYTDYPAAFVILVFFVWKRKFSWVVFLCILLLFLPWVPTFFNQLRVAADARINAPIWWETLGKANFKQIALVPVKFLIGRISFSNKVLYTGVVLFYLLEFGTPIVASFKKLKESRLVFLWFSLPLFVAVLLGFVGSGFSYFRLLFLLPPFYLLVAHGVSSQKKGGAIFRVGLNLAAIVILISNQHFWREDWRSAVSWVESDAGDKTAASIFVTNNQRDPYFYYSQSKTPSYGPDGLQQGGFERIYLFRYVQPIFDPQDMLRKKIESSGYQKIDEKDFNGVTIWKYERKIYANKNPRFPRNLVFSGKKLI